MTSPVTECNSKQMYIEVSCVFGLVYIARHEKLVEKTRQASVLWICRLPVPIRV